MTSPYDIRTDAPNMLRSESLRVGIAFNKTSSTTGRISWNIPTPLAGCTADNQAYCGMLVTINTEPPTTYVIPVDGEVYSSDPTADNDLFAGDRIGTAKVVGAFYQDKTTTFVDVSGLTDGTAYYVSGYPVDCQHRYYIEGVHAFSNNDDGILKPASKAFQIVYLNFPTGVQSTQSTGLAPSVTYTFKAHLGIDTQPQIPKIGGIEYATNITQVVIQVDGSNALTYGDLTKEINKQFAKLSKSTQSPVPPGTGSLYVDLSSKTIKKWDGHKFNNVSTAFYQTAVPSSVSDGALWAQPMGSAYTLRERVGDAWNTVEYIKSPFNPFKPVSDESVWLSNGTAYLWNGYGWCELPTTISSENPLDKTSVPVGSFWLKKPENVVYRWNNTTQMWVRSDALESSVDLKNPLTENTYWLNTGIDEFSKLSTSLVWEPAAVRFADVAPVTPQANSMWYSPMKKQLYKRSADNTTWIVQAFVAWNHDPLDLSNCSIWWKPVIGTGAVDELYIHTQTGWTPALNFYTQVRDPATPDVLIDGDAWWNPTTGELHIYQGGCYITVEYVNSPTDPMLTIAGFWYNDATKKWFKKSPPPQVHEWTEALVTEHTSDPALLTAGAYWFNPSTNNLQVWNGIDWIPVLFSTAPPVPQDGATWYDTMNGTLHVWDGAQWNPMAPVADVVLNSYGFLQFTHNVYGSKSGFLLEDVNLFASLTDVTVRPDMPVYGADEVLKKPTYQQLGVGTDGTADERAELMNDIRLSLGYPNVDVEITPEQLNLAINQALELFRARSGLAYKRGFMKLAIQPETQRYVLSNKAAQYNRIVSVMGVYRMTSAFLSTSHGAGIYGQMVLQQLYNMGTFDLLSYHIVAEYTKLMEILFAARLTYTFHEETRELHMFHRFPYSERSVLMEVTVERTEQDIMKDRKVRPWMRNMATAYAKLMLAETRGKFATLPGPGGAISLNANDLRQSAEKAIADGIAEIEDYIVDDIEEYGSGAQVVFG